MPVANRQCRRSVDSEYTNNAQAENGTRLESFAGDQRHRVRKAEARAHRLRDLVERVDFAVRVGDIVEYRRPRAVGQLLRTPGPWRTGGAQRLRGGRIQRIRVFGVRRQAWQCVHEHIDDARVERFTGFLLQQRDGGVGADGFVIRTVRRERHEIVGDADDPRAEWDRIFLEARRIAAAVPPLMVAQDQRCDRIGKRHRSKDLGAHFRVNLDLLKLFRRQWPRLREDVFRDGELADVAKEGGGTDGLHFVVRHAERVSQPRGVRLHAAEVFRSGLILGVDGARERLDCREVQIDHLLAVVALVFDLSEMPLVNEIQRGQRNGDEPQDRKRQHRRCERGPGRRQRRAGNGERAACAIGDGKRPMAHRPVEILIVRPCSRAPTSTASAAR